MTWFFFVDRETGKLVAIIMTDGFTVPLAVEFGVTTENPSVNDYWDIVDESFVSSFLDESHEIYEYDLSSEGDNLESPLDPDPGVDLDWEIPPIQSWVRGQALHREYIASVSHFLGLGSEFAAEEIFAGNIYEKLFGKDETPGPKLLKPPARCLWCEIPIERRYNLALDGPMNPHDIEEFEDPIVWSDGIVMERDGIVPNLYFPPHYGDSVLVCAACGATFLASELEMKYPRINSFPDYAEWSNATPLVVPGNCTEGAYSNSEENSIVALAPLEATLNFVDQAQSRTLINWEEWIAIQQAVNQMSYLDRKFKLNSTAFSSEFENSVKRGMEKFLERIEQIKAGTLGSMSPFREKHRLAIEDENFWVHNFEVQEVLPIANMMRICGRDFFDWATPKHPAIEVVGQGSGWSEFDLWIALRGKALLESLKLQNRDWAIAIDTRGVLINF